ncbi:hypothetical protein LXL04_001241 [Taraxacum kok-saghyz]
MAEPKKIIIDTDPGIGKFFFQQSMEFYDHHNLVKLFSPFHHNPDDAMAIFLALRSPEVILEVAGRTDIPVAEGSHVSYMKATKLQVREFVHGVDGLGNQNFPPPKSTPIEKSAAEYLVEQANLHPGEITIVALGPLTNIALAIKLDPTFTNNIGQIVLLGGDFAINESVNPTPETNICGDPEAADIVFTSGANVLAVGMNVTRQVIMNDNERDKLAKSDGIFAKYLCKILHHYFSYYRDAYNIKGIYLHDPTALLATVDPSLIRYTEGVVRVQTSGVTRGVTLFDEENEWRNKLMVKVAVSVDAPTVVKLIMIDPQSPGSTAGGSSWSMRKPSKNLAMTGAGKEGGTSNEEGAVKKLGEQLGILQIQNASHGTDIREINHRIETIVIQQEEMRLTNEELGRSLAKLPEKMERNEERATGTPMTQLGGGTTGNRTSGTNFSTADRTSGGNGTPIGSGEEIPSGGGRRQPEPINVGLGFNHEYRHRKVDMPAFNGTDPDGWILQAERYFAIYQLIDEEKLEAAVLSLSGDALAWYRWSDKQQAILTWERMELLFLKRFRSIQGGDLRFIELSAPLEGITSRIAIGSFIKGLKPNIRNELRTWAPQDLGRAMDLAQQIEEKNRSIRSSGFGALGYRPTQSLTRPISNLNQNGNTGMVPGNTYRRGQGTDRPLTEAHIQDKRARGLCYKCDEKWQRNHRCKFQVNVILVEEEEEEEEGALNFHRRTDQP